QAFVLTGPDGKPLPLQSWPLAYWPDGSLKWSAFATVARMAPASLRLEARTAAAVEGPSLTLKQQGSIIDIDTGAMKTRLRTSGANLIDSISVDGREVALAGQLVAISQRGPDVESGAAPQRDRYISQINKVTVEQSGPVRAVVKVD